MKCVVLGFGYLAQYLLPCIRRFTGGANADLIGVKATTTGLDALRAKYAFRVQAGDAEQALLQLRLTSFLLYIAMAAFNKRDIT